MNKEKRKNEFTTKQLVVFLFVAVALNIILTKVIRPTKINGESMEYTLKDGEWLLVNLYTYNTEAPKHGDLIIVDRPDLSVRFFVKRVIAIQGDTIEIKDNTVLINGEKIKEPYIKEDMFTDDYPIKTIPEGKLFVMGDNRNGSMDSRSDSIGLVDIKEEVNGKAIYHLPSFKKIE